MLWHDLSQKEDTQFLLCMRRIIFSGFFFFNAKKEPHSQQVFLNESFWLSLLGCPYISPLFPCCFMTAVFLEVAEAVVASGWDVQGGGRQGVALSRGRLFCRPLECEELQM